MGEGAAAEEHELDVVGEEGVLFVEVEEVEEELDLVLELDHLRVEDEAGEQLQAINEEVLVGIEDLKDGEVVRAEDFSELAVVDREGV